MDVHPRRWRKPHPNGPAIVAALLVSAAGAPWWSPALAVVMIAAFLLGRRDGSRLIPFIAVLAGVASAALRWAADDRQFPALVAVCAGLTVVVALGDGAGRLVHARECYREQGWRLAEALRDRELAATESARVSERARIAAEMHDSLGHDIALLAMQLSALQVEVGRSGVPSSELVSRLGSMRIAAAEATQTLHHSIGLLQPSVESRGGGETDRQQDLEDRVRLARSAGLDVQLDAGPGDLRDCSIGSATLVQRFVEESLTNAAKHAPTARLRLSIVVGADEIEVLAITQHIADGHPHATMAVGSGRGLASLAERADRLGGWCRASRDADGFRVEARIAKHAAAAEGHQSTAPAQQLGARAVGQDRITRRRRALLVVPAAIVAGAVVLIGVGFTVANLASVLPRDRFEAIHVGQPQRAAEALLPPIQLPDEPQTVAEPTQDCRYYEEHVSFFERVTTFQVCFADGEVAAATEIPGDRSR